MAPGDRTDQRDAKKPFNLIKETQSGQIMKLRVETVENRETMPIRAERLAGASCFLVTPFRATETAFFLMHGIGSLSGASFERAPELA